MRCIAKTKAWPPSTNLGLTGRNADAYGRSLSYCSFFTRKTAIRLRKAAAFASAATLIFVRQVLEWLRLFSLGDREAKASGVFE
jgi:hypothetical protein